jgi:hypothetical protein
MISDAQRCQQITMEQVLRHLGHFSKLKGAGPQRYGPCPIHSRSGSRDQCFSVNLRKNVFRCFSSHCRAAGTSLHLWAAVHRLPLPQAARHMARTFGVQ